MPLSDDVHREIESELRHRLIRLVGAGRDVVLDFSFWSRGMRDEWRHTLEPYGAVPELVYLATDRATCLERIAARAQTHGDDFALDAETAAAYVDNFEPPAPDETPLTITDGSQLEHLGGLTGRCDAR